MAVDEVPEAPIATLKVLQFAQRLRFDLTNALARYPEALTHLLQRTFAVIDQPMTQFENQRLTFSEPLERQHYETVLYECVSHFFVTGLLSTDRMQEHNGELLTFAVRHRQVGGVALLLAHNPDTFSVLH